MIVGVKSWFLALGAVLMVLVISAFWLASRALVGQLSDDRDPQFADKQEAFAPREREGHLPTAHSISDGDEEDGALKNERVLIFKDSKSMEDFLSRQGKGFEVLGVIGALNAVRVSFTDLASLLRELGDDDQQVSIFPVMIPPLPEGGVQAGAVAVGNRILEWLGVDQAGRNWGEGVKIAVLDTGVVPDSTMGKVSQFIDLVAPSADLSLQNGHGTAVASLIVGQTSEVPGIAPAAEIISVRVADDQGVSNSFLLAQGIIEAVDAGAQLINISMGGFGSSDLLQQAVDYARERGALVIAATGNNGINLVQYPAALEWVIGVGAVDALGQHLDFSNTGYGVDVAAPGLGVNANWMDGRLVSGSGTSFSAPIVTGVIAAVMTAGSSQNLSAWDAWALVGNYLNDSGAAGPDSVIGAGMPDLGRVINRDVAGLYDAALASMTLLAPDAGHPYGQVEVLVQNRGTETLVNTGLNIDSGGVLHRVNLTALEPGAVQTVLVPVNTPISNGLADALRVSGVVWLGDGQADTNPKNDARSVIYTAEE